MVTAVWSHIVDRFAVAHRVDRCVVTDKEDDCADVFTTCTNGTREGSGQDEIARARGLPGKARSVHSRVHADAEETELGFAQGRACAFDELCGSDDIHSWHWPQLARALDRAGARRPREGPAGSAVPHRTRDFGRGGRGESQAGAFEVWGEAAQGCGSEVKKLRRNEVATQRSKEKAEEESTRFRSDKEQCHAKDLFSGVHKRPTRSMPATSWRNLSAR